MTIKPTAAPAIWPYPHRTLEQVWRDEEARRGADRTRYARERKSYRTPDSSTPGRYALSGHQQFTALCGADFCGRTVTICCGESGSVRAPHMLRKNGWGMVGVSNRAKWFCPEHTPMSSRRAG